MAEIRTLKLNMLADIDQFKRGMTGAKGEVDNLGYKIGQFSKKAAAAFAVVAAAAGYMAVRLGKESIDAASDLNETISKTNVIFGDAAEAIFAFSKTTSKSLGISQKAALDAASTFATFGKAAGLTGKDLSSFSIDLTKLSSDFASFFNTSPEEAITAIGAALRGESEPIRKYGVLLNDATLKARAMEMGLYSGTGALDQQAKVLAAYQEILNQTKDAQGDFARTSDGLANQQRILSSGIEEAKASLGEIFLPIAKDAVIFFNTSFIPVIKDVIAGFKGAAGADGLAQAADEVAHRFGERESGLTATARNLAAAFGDSDGLTPMARNLQAAFGTKDETSSGKNLGAAIFNLTEQLGKLFGAILDKGPDGVSVLDSIADSLNKIAKAIEAVGKAYNIYKESAIGKLFGTDWGQALTTSGIQWGGVRAAGGSVMAGKAYRVGEFGPETFIPNGVSGRIVPNAGGGNVTVNLNGIIDGESARRTIEKLLQDSARRTGAINLTGAVL